MKKNKFVTSALAATLLMSGSAATAATVFANGADGGTTGTTNTVVDFTKPEEPVQPLLPINPDEPAVTPKGTLSLIYVTDLLDFGQHRAGEKTDFTAEKGDQAYTADKQVIKGKDTNPTQNFFMQVSDARADGIGGWKVSGNLKSDEGITITFPQADKIHSSLFQEGQDGLGNVTTAQSVLSNNADTPFFQTTAAANGYGSWLRENDATKIMMTVPANKQAGKITNTITWTLAANPEDPTTEIPPVKPTTPPSDPANGTQG